MLISLRRACAVCLLALLFTVCAAIHAQSAPTGSKPTTGPDHLAIVGTVQKGLLLSIDDLRKLPHTSIQVTNPHTNKLENYEGVLLSDLLHQSGVPAGERDNSSDAIAEGADGYQAIFVLANLDSGVLVAYSVDGAPIPGNAGPFRLIVANDKGRGRWVRMLMTITVHSDLSK